MSKKRKAILRSTVAGLSGAAIKKLMKEIHKQLSKEKKKKDFKTTRTKGVQRQLKRAGVEMKTDIERWR